MAEQLALNLPHRTALGAADFLVAPPNEAAYALVTGPNPWPQGKLVLVGPEGSGKSHLAGLWRDQTGALEIHAHAIDPADPPLDTPRLLVEGVDDLRPEAEEWLFHTHNALLNRGGLLLMTARSAPSRWGTALPDLASRLQATTMAVIDDPDDALLTAILVKLFADRQLPVSPDVLSTLLARMERSFRAASALVAAIDEETLKTGHRISPQLAARVMRALPPRATE